MAPRDNEPSLFDDQEGPDLSSPREGFELYRHKNADTCFLRKLWAHSSCRMPSATSSLMVSPSSKEVLSV